MGWFDHQHCWHAATGLNHIYPDAESKRASMALIMQECRCGAVRTIEYGPGIAPVVRMAETGDTRGIDK